MLMPTYTSVLQTIDRKAADLDLSVTPALYVSYLYDGSKIILFIQDLL